MLAFGNLFLKLRAQLRPTIPLPITAKSILFSQDFVSQYDKFIKNQFGSKEKKFKKIEEMQEQGKLTISALAFIRGRSLSNVIFIIDEAQNLTPHEVKTIITRAGENTKIIFTGDVFQIDTPYLDEQSNGFLSYRSAQRR